MPGDLILEVNGKDLRTAAYEQVAYTLKVELISYIKKNISLFGFYQTLPHSRVYIKIGRLKGNTRQNLVPNESKIRSRSSSANKINDR